MTHADSAARTPVSIVCVFNDPDVLAACLARSVESGRADAPETELIAVDNRGNPFATAGGALNDGARRARHPVVVFVHQDVVLHSLIALERAAGILLADRSIGILGAVGIDAEQTIVGRIRDRVVPIGEPASQPRDIDSLDEVLFMIRRDLVTAEPLTEDPLLAWHAYGVEYCARMRSQGLRAVALDLPLTHNSLTTNLKDLDLAHARVGALYPGLLPLRTTCGTIWKDAAPHPLVRQGRRVRGARIWWGESVEARGLSRVSPGSDVVLADVRLVIDEALERGDRTTLRVLDLERPGLVPTSASDLVRFGRSFAVDTVSAVEARAAIERRSEDELLLVTAGAPDDLAAIGPLASVPHVIGHSRDTGFWVVIGVSPETLAPLWDERRNRPFGGLLRGGRRRPADVAG